MLRKDQAFLHAIQSFIRLYKYCKHEARKRRGADLTGRKIALLRFVLENGPSTQGELGEYLLVNKSSTSEMLASLEAMGLVTRKRSENDARQVLINLSKKGRETAEQVQVTGIPLLREKLSDMPQDLIENFGRIVDEINEKLEIPENE